MTVTVITGSSTGIGAATALRLARDEHSVVATMRTPEASDLGAKAAAENLEIDVRALDVTDEGAVSALFAAVVKDYGQIDVLVNNAGVGGSGPVEELEISDFAAAMETNFFGVLRCTKAVLPQMRERGEGSIVTVSSQAGRLAAPLMTQYCASKYAIEAAMEGLAVEVGRHGIRVAIIEPGAILTPIWGKQEIRAPEGPYGHLIGRLSTFVMSELAKGSSAEEVAYCIAEAIVADPPKLRWLVGQGAERNIRNRAGWTDEEFNALWNQPDDDAFLKAMLAE